MLFPGKEDTKKKAPFHERKKEWLKAYDDHKHIPKEALSKYKKLVADLEDKDYLVIGYGSLLNISDVWRTSPNLISHKKGYIDGWRRIFNMGSNLTGCYLNVEKSKDTKDMLVSILQVPVDDMPDLFMREINYSFETQEFRYEIDDDELHTALMVVGTHNFNNHAHPQLNYLHLCMQGAVNLAGQEGATNFIYSTYTNFGSLSSWFAKFNLEYILRSHAYCHR